MIDKEVVSDLEARLSKAFRCKLLVVNYRPKKFQSGGHAKSLWLWPIFILTSLYVCVLFVNVTNEQNDENVHL